MKEGTPPNVVTSDLTTNKVQSPNNELTFTKYSNTPGHDLIQINLTLNYKSDNPQSQIVKKIDTAGGRVSAATFDSSLLPGGTIGNLDIGQATQYWKNLFLSGNYKVEDGKVSEPANYGDNRGYKIIGAFGTAAGFFGEPSLICGGPTGVCAQHGLDCVTVLRVDFDAVGVAQTVTIASCPTPPRRSGTCLSLHVQIIIQLSGIPSGLSHYLGLLLFLSNTVVDSKRISCYSDPVTISIRPMSPFSRIVCETGFL